MKVLKIKLFVLLFAYSAILSGCWNYREINKISIVAGMAVDKGENGDYMIHVELVDTTAEKENVAAKTKVVKEHGETIFDAVRKLIGKTGRRLYWNHAKVIIISREIAESSVVPVLDWVSRDAEVREDLAILISLEETAAEILHANGGTDKIVSYNIDTALKAQSSTGAYSRVRFWEFVDDLDSSGVQPIAPTVYVSKDDEGKDFPMVRGTALFCRDKMIGLLNGYETQSLLWLRKAMPGGLVITKEENFNVTMEVFGSKTRIKPVTENNQIIINVQIKLDLGIAEISSTMDVIKEPKRNELKAHVEEEIEKQIKTLVEKLQKVYQIDPAGFGQQVEIHLPTVWKEVKPKWNEVFKDIAVDVKVDVKIRGSALVKKPVEIGG